MYKYTHIHIIHTHTHTHAHMNDATLDEKPEQIPLLIKIQEHSGVFPSFSKLKSVGIKNKLIWDLEHHTS